MTMAVPAAAGTWTFTLPNGGGSANQLLQTNGSGTTSWAGYGIDQNILLTKTANYTIANTDCGKTIQAGSGATGYFTLTLPGVGGFDTACKVTVTNGDTGRSKALSGFPSNVSPVNKLWPLQTVVVEIVNGAWVSNAPPGRWRFTGAVTLNVDPINGLDTNDGLATGAGNALQTFQKAWDMSADNFDLNSQTLTILSAASQTYTAGISTGKPQFGLAGASSAVINCNGSTVATNGGGDSYDFSAGNVALTTPGAAVQFYITGCILQNPTTGGALTAAAGAHIQVGPNMTFGPTNREQINVTTGGSIIMNSDYTVSGGGSTQINAQSGGSIYESFITVTCTGNYTFTAWAQGSYSALIAAESVTYTGCGSTTATKYISVQNAVVNRSLPSNPFPGGTAGYQTTGGIYGGLAAPDSIQVFTSGTNASYSPAASVSWIEVEMVGPGGGGTGSGTTPAAPGAAGNTCWNISSPACTTPVYQSGGGGIGLSNGNASTGGTVSGTGTCSDSQPGGKGGAASNLLSMPGGEGGSSRFGGEGRGGAPNSTTGSPGTVAASNSGSGGGGAGDGTTINNGGGGAAGAWCKFIWNNPSGTTFVYTVGAGGTAGGAGTGGAVGGAGSDGKIVVTEHH
jgi:hypothetical protein